VVGLTVEQTIATGGVAAGLLLVRTFCWYWRLRCQRKNALAVLDKLRELGKDPVRAGAETTTYPTPFCPRNDGGGRGRRGPNPLPVPPQVGYR
jgi:hypothetical protein